MVKIKMHRNASEMSDRDPMAMDSRRFITHRHVASSRASIGDPTDAN